MQTFAPYADLALSFRVLDYKRLGKQRVEAMQIINRLVINDKSGESCRGVRIDNLKGNAAKFAQSLLGQDMNFILGGPGWSAHPAVRQWEAYVPALAVYHDACIAEWITRGYNNTMKPLSLQGKHEMPPWWGDERFHSSHRAKLLGKNPVYYGQYGWTEDPAGEYFWPTECADYQ